MPDITPPFEFRLPTRTCAPNIRQIYACEPQVPAGQNQLPHSCLNDCNFLGVPFSVTTSTVNFSLSATPYAGANGTNGNGWSFTGGNANGSMTKIQDINEPMNRQCAWRSDGVVGHWSVRQPGYSFDADLRLYLGLLLQFTETPTAWSNGYPVRHVKPFMNVWIGGENELATNWFWGNVIMVHTGSTFDSPIWENWLGGSIFDNRWYPMTSYATAVDWAINSRAFLDNYPTDGFYAGRFAHVSVGPTSDVTQPAWLFSAHSGYVDGSVTFQFGTEI